MRRPMQALSKEVIDMILKNAQTGVLGLLNNKGYPYTVPINFIALEKEIYFHGSYTGEKMTCIQNCSKASFTVVSRDEIFQEGLTTLYESVVGFGDMKIVENKAEKEKALRAFIYKYTPDFIEKGELAIKNSMDKTCVFKMALVEITGKKSK